MLTIKGRDNIIPVIIIIDHIKTSPMAEVEMHLLGNEMDFYFKQEQWVNT